VSMLKSSNGKLVDAITAQLTNDSDPTDDVHRLAVLARLPLTHSVQQRDRLVTTLVHLEDKVARFKRHQDSSWSERLKDIWVTLALTDPYLAPSLVNHPDFGQPGHAVFLNQMPPELLPVARTAFARQIAATPNYAWTNDVVFALGESDEAVHRNLLRAQFDRFAVRGAVLVVLSRKPEAVDRDKFIAGLEWSQTEVQSACLKALDALGPGDSAAEQLALLRSLRRLGADENAFEPGRTGYRPQPETVTQWTAWCRQKWPEETAAHLGENGSELTKLLDGLKEIDWAAGDAKRGAELYTRRACIQCHGASGALGPDLAGAANRFSKEDLFTAIVLPSRDVSARYQTTIVQTKDGKTYSGLVVYESVDGFMLRNGTGQTFRIETPQIDELRKTSVSLMPMGLLKDLPPREYADLYAYLKSLGAKTNEGGATSQRD
jgi:putative heme-binding domain-containing protein